MFQPVEWAESEKKMLYDLFVVAVNMYQTPGEGWEDDVEYQVKRCMDSGKKYDFLLKVIHAAWEVA